jgi:sodium transport system permease protein
MNWTNIKLIFCREVRDQLRDRRTLFMIAVLPLLLYPLLGMSFLQISQFLREHATKVLVIGVPTDQDLPSLVHGEHFSTSLFTDPERAKVLNVTVKPSSSRDEPAEIEQAKNLVLNGKYEVVVYFPESFNTHLAAFRKQLLENRSQAAGDQTEGVPDPVIYYNDAKEKSDMTFRRVQMVLQNWREAIVTKILSDSHLPAQVAKPFEVATGGVAKPTERQAALWSKVLPFVLLLWALTGAFYPAVDLCAGEKERGTLETLLSSPAERSEIVWGKLLTIMLFSVATAILNLLSMGLTGSFVLSMLPHNFGSPPYWAIPILLAALLPMAALFSALCLALAAFARSTKEGQYYLMPLVLITMPLTILPMSPGVELNLGNSLIPVTGVVLLLRSLLENNWIQALPYIPPVVAVTLGCCLLAVRWAADQFNAESVLFRESERFDLVLWLRRMMEDRGETPSVPQAVACGVMILMLQFFMNFAIPDSTSFVLRVAIPMLACILTPALLMSVMLTTNVRKTLLLKLPSLGTLAAAVLLAFCIHPLSFVLREVVERLYPMPEGLAERLNEMIKGTSTSRLLFFAAVLPAICEELAFRGFVLSGLRHLGHKWRAIVVSSLFFGIAHGVFQQSLIASLLGTVIAYVAVQTGSILPGMIFHALHNSLQILVSKLTAESVEASIILKWLINPQAFAGGDHTFNERIIYFWPVCVVAALGTIAILYWLHRLPYARSKEEKLQESIEECDAKDVDLSTASAAAGS